MSEIVVTSKSISPGMTRVSITTPDNQTSYKDVKDEEVSATIEKMMDIVKRLFPNSTVLPGKS